jgi:hypothetical protein
MIALFVTLVQSHDLKVASSNLESCWIAFAVLVAAVASTTLAEC